MGRPLLNIDLFGGPDRPPGPVTASAVRRSAPVERAPRPRWWYRALDYLEPRDLAGPLAEFAAAIDPEDPVRGARQAFAVAELYGGRKEYIPSRPDPEHPLMVALGAEDAIRLCAEIGGVDWRIPSGYRLLGPARRRLVRALYEELGSQRRVAEELGISEAMVRRQL